LENIDYFLFDTFTEAYGGSGKTFNWEILLDYPFEKPFLLSGGLGLENVAAIKALNSKIPQMVGVDINSRFEMEPGMKNLDLISRFRMDI
jgi:phosphoribosylanthranilate isomerase